MWKFFHKLASPKYFYDISGKLLPWIGWMSLFTVLAGLYLGLVKTPPDYQQGESYRIIYIHVPAAWLSMFIYMVMAVSGAIFLIWKIKLAEIVAFTSAPIGASFTFLALATGSLWGKPMWGTWWVWDARLTSELILLFLYFGVMALYAAIEDKRNAARAAAVLALVGVVNIPIIHYSVEWWNTLHQGATVTKFAKPSIAPLMLWSLLLMAVSGKLYYMFVVLKRARVEVLSRERQSTWAQDVVLTDKKSPVSLVTWALLLLSLGTFVVLSVLGIQTRNLESFTPAEVLASKTYSYIPIWVSGNLETVEEGLYTLSAADARIFVTYTGDIVTPAAVLGRIPECVPATPACALEARMIVAQDSMMKYFYMGGYAFFVWVSYGLALVLLLFNLLGSFQREAELKKILARQARRQAVPNNINS
jgi:heme exporter protein C